MEQNYLLLFATALIPMIIGSIWYSPKLFGNTWMKVAGKTEDELQSGNMAVILGVAYLFSIILSFALTGLAIHQSGVFQLFAMDVAAGTNAENIDYFNNFMQTYGDKHRSFGHGALHGALAALFFALPLVGINALFERRGWKYIMIHLGYWMLTMTLISGVLCAYY